MSVVHFLNVLEGDCNIIQHDSERITVVDVSNADNHVDTPAETAKKLSQGRKDMRERNYVPTGKTNYGQKLIPDNPIDYLKSKVGTDDIFRFIITHPDMDHLDGIKDLFDSFKINVVWDTNNKKELSDFSGGGYNVEDWEFYKGIRDQTNKSYQRRTYLSGNQVNLFDKDFLHIIAPTKKLINDAIECNDYNDSSLVLLYTPPKKGGGTWKILFAGDSHDKTWDYILGDDKLKKLVTNVDVLFAPHHGRGSNRKYDFLNTVSPRMTLFGNASCNHLAYDEYKRENNVRITNNQAGYVIMDINEDRIIFYVKNEEFAVNFKRKRGWIKPFKNTLFDAYSILQFSA